MAEEAEIGGQKQVVIDSIHIKGFLLLVRLRFFESVVGVVSSFCL